MYKILIIEDEKAARKKLHRYLDQLLVGEYKIVGEPESVEEVQKYFAGDISADIIFSDIELRDGNVFEAYAEKVVDTPIIFTTAYNEFLMNAFETNGIEYLLKPYSFERFSKAWSKYIGLRGDDKTLNNDLISQLGELIQNQESAIQYIDQLAIKSTKGIYFIKTDDIVYLGADQGLLFAVDYRNKKHLLPQQTLKELDSMLNPSQFFKINRSELVNRKFIERLERYDKNSYAIYLLNESIVLKSSQSITPTFSKWLGL
ncbi:MAG: LytTR family DNA-binding domain-containing protein [Fulvivirga sp.]